MWPVEGWWGRPESLQLPSEPGPALDAYHAARADSDALVVLLTGRRVHLRSAVLGVLASHGAAQYHAALFNDGGLDTLSFKTKTLRHLLAGVGAAVRAVHVYEDRPEHAAAFERLGADLAAGRAWRVHLVTAVGRASDAAPPPQPQLPEEVDDDPPAAEVVRPTVPAVELLHYVRLTLPVLPAEAAAVPAAWREAKRARDGDWPPAHVTLINSAELREVAPDRASRAALVRLLRRVRPEAPRVLGLACAVGVGAEEGAAAAFLCVECHGGAWLRRQLGLPPADFHITLGFDGADVHVGVRKGRTALLPTPQCGWGAPHEALPRMAEALLRRVASLRARARRYSRFSSSADDQHGQTRARHAPPPTSQRRTVR